jgi:putative Holliday junction resolvase
VSRVLAVDWGERRIGVAISDPQGIIATGLETLVVKSPEHAANRVAELAREREADRIVVGLPLLMSGLRGEAAEAAERFAALLERRTGLPVDTYDERLTSALSERRLRETGVRAGQQRGRVDQGAAVALLESYLMRLKAHESGSGAGPAAGAEAADIDAARHGSDPDDDPPEGGA